MMRVLTLFWLAGSASLCAQSVTFPAARRSFDFPSGQFFQTVGRACRPVVAVADFNGDGRVDLMVGEITASTDHGFRLAGLLGNGDGTFIPNGPPKDPTPGFLPPVAVADFDGDGIADVAIANLSSVTMAWGNGDGTFRVNFVEAPPPSFPEATLMAADVDGDSKPDLVLLNEQGGIITVFLNTGGGYFRRVTTSGAPSSPFSVAAGDFDHDGMLDLAIAHGGANPGDESGISIYLGVGDGTFRRGVEVASGSAVLSVVAADFDADGNLDLAVGGSSDGRPAVVVFTGLGDGTFRAADSAQPAPVCLITADFDNDGRPDLLSQDTLSPDSHLFRGNGDGTFAVPVAYHSGSRNTGILAADFNGDGVADVATLDYTFTSASILLNDGFGAFSAPPDYPACCASQATHWVGAADLDGDGAAELIYTTFDPGNLAILKTNADLTLSETASYQLNVGLFPPLIADFNGDGISDVAVFNDINGIMTILLGRAYSSPLMFTSFSIGAGAGVMSSADVNGDGIADILVTRLAGADMSVSTIDILPGNGDGTFRAPVALSVDAPAGLHQLAAGDFNGDGRIDLILSSQQSYPPRIPVLLLLAGNGDGTFAAPNPIEGLTQVGALAAGDLNGDGMLDLVVADSRQGLLLLAGNGDGTFRQSVLIPSIPGGWLSRTSPSPPFWVGDINGDGLPDVIYRLDRDVAVQLGNGDGTLGPITRFGASDFQWFAVADLNGDKKPDLVVSHAGGVAVLWNTTEQSPPTP